MKKLKIGLFVCCLALSKTSWSACTGLKPNWTATADKTSILDCIQNKAEAGDTVSVLPGTFEMPTVTLTKSINLIGSGVETSSWVAKGTGEFMLEINPADYSINNPIRVSGFTFDMAGIASAIEYGQQDKTIPRNSASSPTYVLQDRVRIDHIKFTNAGSDTHIAIWNSGSVRGVIDSNTFDKIPYPMRTIPSENGTWWDAYKYIVPGDKSDLDYVSKIHYGDTKDNVYIEDNVFNQPSVLRPISGCQEGGRYVFRYNTINMISRADPLFDLHGNGPGTGLYACFGGEIYANSIITPSNQHFRFVDQRAGRMLVFGNQIDTPSTDVITTIREEHADDRGTENTDNQMSQHVSESYYWNNKRKTNSALSNLVISPSDDVGDTIHVNKEYFSDQSISGATNGVLCGPNHSAAACNDSSKGFGFWETSDTCGVINAARIGQGATPLTGTLYRCEAGAWKSFFTPAQYPHPLRGSQVSDRVAPSAPSNLRAP